MTATLLVLQFLLTQPLAKADGSVAALHGSAVSIKEGVESNLKIGSKIKSGETVKTKSDGTLVINYSDGTKLKLKENTEAIVQGVDREPNPTAVQLIAGAIFAQIPREKNQHFQIKTKTAVAGVRGTKFFTSVGEKDAFWLCVDEGSVDVTPSGSQSTLSVPKGLGVLVEAGKKPEPPKPYGWTKKLNWNMDSDKGDVIDHTVIEHEYKSLLHYHYD